MSQQADEAQTFALEREALAVDNGVTIYNGGFGSGMARSKTNPEMLYFMTDRGPNINGTESGQKVFPVWYYAPAIAVYKYDGTSLTFQRKFSLREKSGAPLTGLPNPIGAGGTGETAVTSEGFALPNLETGIDPEGISFMNDDTFWVSDEYGPHIIHFDANGNTIERINPFGNGVGGRTIPKVFATRRANRGMEGLTVTPDDKWVVGIMQSAMYNPFDDRTNIRTKSNVTRLLFFNIETGDTKQFVYLQEAPNLSNSEIRALSNDEFIILERDGRFAGHPTSPAVYKRFYKIDVSEATDVSDPSNSEQGLTFEIDGVTKTLEQMTPAELAAQNIKPVKKELFIDLLDQDPNYPHDKPEGFIVFENGTLGIVNDDDFGIIGSEGKVAAKILPATGEVDENIFYITKFPGSEPKPDESGSIDVVGEYNSGIYDESAAEIVTYDRHSQRLFVSNADNNGIDIIDIRNPDQPKLINQIKDLGGNVNSVSVKNGIVAVAVENDDEVKKGWVVFLDALLGSELNRLKVGVLPDMLTFSPDGTMVVVANEGQPNDDYTIDPEGSISVIYLGGGSIVEVVLAEQSDVANISFAPYDFLADFFIESGIRIFGEINDPVTGEFLRYSRPSEDFEPEYVAITHDSRKAYVVLQENNAMAVVDLWNAELIDLFPLGYKDHSLPENAFDASNRDGAINITTWPTLGMYQPDAIAAFDTLGQTFIISANEGDSRDYDGFSEEVRVKDLVLDPAAYPNADELQKDENLGRLKTTTSTGDWDGDGDIDQIYSYGGRSFSIWDANGNLVFDSGSQFERLIAAFNPEDFNSTNDENDSFDNRSDDKGPEPEAVTVGSIAGRLYAFIGLERHGGIMVYDVTYPYEPTFVTYMNNRDFSVEFSDGGPTPEELNAVNDLGPEGVIFIEAKDSPNGKPLVISANEVSGNTSIHTFKVDRKDDFKLQVLHSSDNESSFVNPNTLEPKILHYGAIVDGLQALAAKENIPSIYVTAGDHTLPGPFYEASEEAFGSNGLGDIMFFNAMGLTANGIGNHEFDSGIDDFATMLSHADYPFVAVNLDFDNVVLADGTPEIQRGIDGGSVQQNAGKIVKSAHIMVGGEKIGIIGRAPADFFNVINDPENTLPGLDFVGGRNPADNQPLESAVDQVLEQVALLESMGINKIVLLDHAQDFTADPLSAKSLSGIDIIVAAGSTGFMAKNEANGPFNLLRPGQQANADYPTVREDKDGNTTLVVNSDQLYTYVGNLIVTFDADGHIKMVDERSGPIATTREGMAELDKVLPGYEVRPTREVNNIFRALDRTPLINDLFQLVGETKFPLDGARASVRSRETNLGRLAADSTLWFANEWVASEELGFQVDIALKNGGGIRDSIQGPVITRLPIAAALRFNNELAIMKLTAAELIATMENAISRVPALDGRFPHVAGMELEFIPFAPGVSNEIELTTTSRVFNLVVHRADGNSDVVVEDGMPMGDLTREFTLATNGFLATGGDGYRAFKAINDDPARDVFRPSIGEQQILEDYIVEALDGFVDIPEPVPAPRVRAVDPIQQLFDPSLKPFYHGVASGDPSSDGVILWTRVTPDSEGPVDVTWEISETSDFASVLQTGSFQTNGGRDYTVKVPVSGLAASKHYYYRFSALGGVSMVGRTKTAPDTGVDSLKFAVVSCVNYEAGYFTGFRAIAQMNDVDAVIHLGDSIYEYGRGGFGNPLIANDRRHYPGHEAISLSDYRTRQANYKLDKDLMMARAQFPFIMVWDDHEVADNGWKNGAGNHQEDTEGDYLTRKGNGIQAFHEWNPTSIEGLKIYRKLSFGSMLDLILLDTRHIGRQGPILDVTNPALLDPTRTILGPTQKAWLKDMLSSSTAKWKVIGNQVHFSEVNYWWAGPSVGQTPEEVESQFLDSWDGFPAERSELINFIQSNGINDIVILTGDTHSSWAFEVVDRVDTINPTSDLLTRYNPATGAGAIAMEIGVPSMTSGNFDEFFIGEGQSPAEAAATTAGFEVQINNPIAALGGLNPNPHLKYVDLDRHGFVILTLDRFNAKAEFHYVSDVTDPNATASLSETVTVAGGSTMVKAGQGTAGQVAVDSSQDTGSSDEVSTVINDLPQVSIQSSGGQIHLSHVQISGSNIGLTYQAATSLNGEWVSLSEGDDYSVSVSSQGDGTEIVTVSLDEAGDTQFFRIVLE